MFPDLLFQRNGADIVPTALVFVCSMGGTDKEVLPFFKVACGRVVQLLLAVVAEHKTGEHIALARRRSAVALLPDFLHLIKHFKRDDRRMGVFKNFPVFLWVVSLLLVPNGVGVGLKIDRAAGIFLVFEDIGNCAFMPTVFVLWCLLWCFTPLPLFIGSGGGSIAPFQSVQLLRPQSTSSGHRESFCIHTGIRRQPLPCSPFALLTARILRLVSRA